MRALAFGTIAIAGAVAIAACSSGESAAPPTLGPAASGPNLDAADAGSALAAAAEKFPDLRALWGGAITRTCGPNNGVCHNSKQFPDLQTSAAMLDVIGQRCNQIRDQAGSFDNMCEPPGDAIEIGSFRARIGSITATPATGTPSTLTLTLDQKIPSGLGTTAPAIVRSRSGLPDAKLPFPPAALHATAGASSITIDYAPIADPVKAPGPQPTGSMGISVKGSVATFLYPPVFAAGDDTQVELGDPNGDGIFGATLGGAVIKPGDPLGSYLFLRVARPLAIGPGNMQTNVGAAASNEAQMPLANARYWDAPAATTALWCWIQGMKPDASNADGPIDYAHCDRSKMPPIAAQDETASTFSSVYDTILVPSCVGPCHHAGTTHDTTLVFGDARQTYDVLLGFHGEHPSEKPAMTYVTPGDTKQSFLFLKVSGDPAAGARMPLGGSLPQEQIDAIGKWIDQGANDN